jgi:hypothetical protein
MAAQLSSVRNLGMGTLVDPTSMGQAGPSLARDFNTQANRFVNVMGGQEAFDNTQGRLSGAVRLTPTTSSGSPYLPVLNAQFQMARDSTHLSNYVNLGVNGPINGMMGEQDALTFSGTKARDATRDAQFTLTPEDATGYMDQIDPITKCAAGEQIMLLRGGQPVRQQQIREVYQPYNVLSSQAELVGVSAGNPDQTFLAAYSQPQQRVARSIPLNQPPTNYPSAMSGAGFSNYGSQIP